MRLRIPFGSFGSDVNLSISDAEFQRMLDVIAMELGFSFSGITPSTIPHGYDRPLSPYEWGLRVIKNSAFSQSQLNNWTATLNSLAEQNPQMKTVPQIQDTEIVVSTEEAVSENDTLPVVKDDGDIIDEDSFDTLTSEQTVDESAVVTIVDTEAPSKPLVKAGTKNLLWGLAIIITLASLGKKK